MLTVDDDARTYCTPHISADDAPGHMFVPRLVVRSYV